MNGQSLPGKRGLPLSISARTQPTLQISIARVYSLKVSMTSGARYHLGGLGTEIVSAGEWGVAGIR